MTKLSEVDNEDAASWECVSAPDEATQPALIHVRIVPPMRSTNASPEIFYGDLDTGNVCTIDVDTPSRATPTRVSTETIDGKSKPPKFKELS